MPSSVKQPIGQRGSAVAYRRQVTDLTGKMLGEAPETVFHKEGHDSSTFDHMIDGMLAQIDRNLDLADQRLARI